MNINWKDYISNFAILEKAQINSIETTAFDRRFQRVIFELRMNCNKLLLQMIYSEPRIYPRLPYALL